VIDVCDFYDFNNIMSNYLPYIDVSNATKSTHTKALIHSKHQNASDKPLGDIEMHIVPNPAHTKQNRGEVFRKDDSDLQAVIKNQVATNSNGLSEVRLSKEVSWEGPSEELQRTDTRTSQSAVQEVIQTWHTPYMNRWRLFACCLSVFGNGMNDSGGFPFDLPDIPTMHSTSFKAILISLTDT